MLVLRRDLLEPFWDVCPLPDVIMLVLYECSYLEILLNRYNQSQLDQVIRDRKMHRSRPLIVVSWRANE